MFDKIFITDLYFAGLLKKTKLIPSLKLFKPRKLHFKAANFIQKLTSIKLNSQKKPLQNIQKDNQ